MTIMKAKTDFDFILFICCGSGSTKEVLSCHQLIYPHPPPCSLSSSDTTSRKFEQQSSDLVFKIYNKLFVVVDVDNKRKTTLALFCYHFDLFSVVQTRVEFEENLR